MALSKLEKYVVDSMMSSNNTKEEIAKMLTRTGDDPELNRYYNAQSKKIKKTMFITKTAGGNSGPAIMTEAQSMRIDESKSQRDTPVPDPKYIFKMNE
jgi:hypothetical protein